MREEINASLIIRESDYKKLSHLVGISRSTATYDLDTELAKADICPDDCLPESAVALYDKVHFRDINTGGSRIVTIVMPWESNVTELKISILSPVGIALIGERVGTTIKWPLLNGKSALLEIKAIIRPKSEVLDE